MEEEKELSAEEMQAAFDEGERSVRGEPPHTKEPEAQPLQEEKEDEPIEEVTDGEDSPETPIDGIGLTPSEIKSRLAMIDEIGTLKSALEKETQKIYGKFGEVEKIVKGLREGRKKLTPETFKSLIDIGYEDLAESLAKDLGSVETADPVDPEAIRQNLSVDIDARVNALKKEYETRLLTMKHPDWQQKTKTDDWKLWVGTLPQDAREELANSEDGLWLASKFSEFDAWKTRGKEKTSRLDQAMQPKGTPVQAKGKKQLTPEEAFLEGEREVMRQRGVTR